MNSLECVLLELCCDKNSMVSSQRGPQPLRHDRSFDAVGSFDGDLQNEIPVEM